jgi:hypothetical protein
MLWQVLLDETPNTVSYMLAGYAVLIGLPLLYVASWRIRRRNLERDLKLMRELERDNRK